MHYTHMIQIVLYDSFLTFDTYFYMWFIKLEWYKLMVMIKFDMFWYYFHLPYMIHNIIRWFIQMKWYIWFYNDFIIRCWYRLTYMIHYKWMIHIVIFDSFTTYDTNHFWWFITDLWYKSFLMIHLIAMIRFIFIWLIPFFDTAMSCWFIISAWYEF